MISWSSQRVAREAGAELLRPAPGAGPSAARVDSRELQRGDLFVGIPGARVDGGAFAQGAIEAGAWGVLTTPAHARAAAAAGGAGAVLAAGDPVAALGSLARAWRRELRARVVAVTGSTGKTSTKDILAALLATRLHTVASRANLNTEIGLPLQILGAQAGTEALVLELAMRGAGQIAELTAIAEPDVGVIVNVGPAHVELLGSLEAIAAAKAELIAGLAPGATAVLPADEPLLAPHLRDDVRIVTFGPGGMVAAAGPGPGPGAGRRGGSPPQAAAGGPWRRAAVDVAGERFEIDVPFSQRHQHENLLAALAAGHALGVAPPGALDVAFSAGGRGERIEMPGGIVVFDDSYNANPMSMRAALDELAAAPAARRVAVLGDMLELGPDAIAYHERIGAHARARGIDVLIAVGPLAAAMIEPFAGDAHAVADAEAAAALLPGLVRPRDAVLVKASRGIGLELVPDALAAGAH